MASWPSRHPDVKCPPQGARKVKLDSRGEWNMWSFADRVVKAVSDVTVGTVIVLVHVMLADRRRRPVAGAVTQRLPS